MKHRFPQDAEKYTQARQRRKRWYKAVSWLACVVVFCTVYALILPAISMEGETYCGVSEHEHSLSCYSDPSADVESAGDWEQSVSGVELTGTWAEDVAAVAASQLGYQESTRNYIVPEDGETMKGYSRYGSWYGAPYEDWSAMFVSFCLNYAEIPEETFPREASCSHWVKLLEEQALYASAESGYMPESGDLVFYDMDGDGDSDHMGIVEETGERLYTIEGDVDGTVCRQERTLDENVLGYGILPDNPETDSTHSEEKTPAEEFQTDISEEVSDSSEMQTSVLGDFYYENDNAEVKFHVDGYVGETSSDQAPVLTVKELETQDADYQRIADAAQESVKWDELLDLSVLNVELCCDGQPVDASACTITAEITPRETLMDAAQSVCAELEEDAAPEAEAGVVFTVLEDTEEGMEELDSAMMEASAQDTPVLTASVDGNGILAFAAAQTANPRFTVQYYAWLDMVATTGSASNNLTVIDTSGGRLPQNGTNPATKTVYLKDAGNGKYAVDTTNTLTKVYDSSEYEYISAPNLTYFNRLYENGNYSLKEIWILKSGKDSNSTNREDWSIYNPAVTHFTNRGASVKEDTVLITDDTVIRLVFDTTKSTYTNASSFYDYNITDDSVHTNEQGINSSSNYSGSGAKLAFGNTNTDTGLGAVSWNGNTLNMYNQNGYKGCTFGLAAGLSNGKIQYADGLTVPNLFNDGGAKGKTSYDSGQYSLSFERVGDTYTLSTVNGAGLTGLQYFNHPTCGNTTYTHIWTNNFWPMDSVKNTDPHTGALNNVGTYIGASGTTNNYPLSDDGLAHNSMFGMQYTVQFTLTEDYSGPLEYYFFGDDDMWVFLDDRLVCDIGGVHSSVGEYVNLWDYIAMGSAGTHTLTFFYTERGLSGSTCYMQFTLPSVSSVTPEQNTGLLTVEKQVEGTTESDEEFHFRIKFTDDAGNNLPDDYSYTRYDANGNIIKKDVIIFDGGSFELKNGEYVVINYLPYGTKYTITETDVPEYYTVAYQAGSGAAQDGNTAAGQIQNGQNGSVVFTNTVRPMLPETGGTGTLWYTTGGVMLSVFAAFLLLYRYSKSRGKEGDS